MALASELTPDEYVEFGGYLPGAAELIPLHNVYVHAARMEKSSTWHRRSRGCGLSLFWLRP